MAVASAGRWLGLAGAMVLGAVLLFAAWTKAIDPEGFAEQIRAEGLADGPVAARAVAFVALGLELGLGLCLLFGVRRSAVLVPAGVLVAFFLFLTGRAYADELRGVRREAVACGCFGNLVERSPAEAFWGDLALLVPPYLLAWIGRPRAGGAPSRRLAAAGIGTAAGLLLAWRAPELPLDDLATRLKPGVAVGELCAGAEASGERICLDALASELDAGRHLVVLADLEGEAFTAGVDALHQHALAGAEPRLWVLADATPEELHAFTWRWGPAFEIRLVPAALLRPLHRRLPRSFLLEDGRVTRTWAGLPPLAGG